MVIYEVNLSIKDEIYSDYYSWLATHIEQILEFRGFLSAEIAKQGRDEAEEATTQLRISYIIDNMDNLSNYLDNHAQRMRDEGLNRFGKKFTASRRIFPEAQLFTLNSL